MVHCYQSQTGMEYNPSDLVDADKLMDLFKDCNVQFVLDRIIDILTTGTGVVRTAARTIFGINHWNANLSDYKNLLSLFYWMILDQVRAFSGWFMGANRPPLSHPQT